MNHRLTWALGGLVFALACGNHEPGPGDDLGSLHAAVELSTVSHDVTALQLKIVEVEGDCAAEPIDSQVVELEAEALGPSLADSGAHPFGDGLFVLEPGSYKVCATPLAGSEPSTECSTAETTAEVEAGLTNEVVLFVQCGGGARGALDVVVALNDQPEIIELLLEPSKFISTCESLGIEAQATDPNDDDLTYTWTVSEGPSGSSLRADGARATFSGPAGDYSLLLEVGDGHGGATSLSFPVHVAEAVCEVPEEVQAIFTSRCAPCHTTGSSGGLRLDSVTSSFANMVGVNSTASACSSRERVVAGDSEASYLMAKLRGEVGICGTPMPRNAPQLPEEELAAIAAWIDGLPH